LIDTRTRRLYWQELHIKTSRYTTAHEGATVMRIWMLTALSLLFVCLFGISVSERNAMAIEEAKYEVMENAEDFELRQYYPHVVAETFVEGNFDEVGNEGFRRLAAYINGKNKKSNSFGSTRQNCCNNYFIVNISLYS